MTHLEDEIRRDLAAARVRINNQHLEFDANEPTGERLKRLAVLVKNIIERQYAEENKRPDYNGPERRRNVNETEAD